MFTDDTQKILITLTLLGVLYLVFKESNYKFTKENFGDDSGASMRFVGERSGPMAFANNLLKDSNTEGLGAYEPPVFWNAGDADAIRLLRKGDAANPFDLAASMSKVGGESTVQLGREAPLTREGMALYKRKAPAYEGMSDNRFSDASLAGAGVGL